VPSLLYVRLATPNEEALSELDLPKDRAGAWRGIQFSRIARPDQVADSPLFPRNGFDSGNAEIPGIRHRSRSAVTRSTSSWTVPGKVNLF
jgi:hypothetical protein